MVSKQRIVLTALVTFALALLVVAPAGALSAPTGLAVSDLVSDPEVFDPEFSWSAVTGAKGYEVEVNSTSSWASGSKVCCSSISVSVKMTTYGTSYSPPVVLPNNTYYWRVRAIDASGNAGPWAAGPAFAKAFANVPSTPAPVVDNLRLVDRNLDTLAPGQRSVVAAVSIDGRSIGETAKSLGMSETAVRVALHRGLTAIATRFGRN